MIQPFISPSRTVPRRPSQLLETQFQLLRNGLAASYYQSYLKCIVSQLHKKTIGALHHQYISNGCGRPQTMLKASEHKNVFSCHLKAT